MRPALSLLLVFGLAACGRFGELDPPPGERPPVPIWIKKGAPVERSAELPPEANPGRVDDVPVAEEIGRDDPAEDDPDAPF